MAASSVAPNVVSRKDIQKRARSSMASFYLCNDGSLELGSLIPALPDRQKKRRDRSDHRASGSDGVGDIHRTSGRVSRTVLGIGRQKFCALLSVCAAATQSPRPLRIAISRATTAVTRLQAAVMALRISLSADMPRAPNG